MLIKIFAITVVALGPIARCQEKQVPVKPAWEVATEFLTLALAGKTDDALKLCIPGTVSKNKVGEIKKGNLTATKTVAVLINDTRIEVVFDAVRDEKGNSGHLVLMLTKSRNGAWLVKDIDFDDADKVKSRVALYLSGKYDLKPDKK